MHKVLVEQYCPDSTQMTKLLKVVNRKREKLYRDLKMTQVLHPEMQDVIEGFSLEVLLMDNKLNRALKPHFKFSDDEFATK